MKHLRLRLLACLAAFASLSAGAANGTEPITVTEHAGTKGVRDVIEKPADLLVEGKQIVMQGHRSKGSYYVYSWYESGKKIDKGTTFSTTDKGTSALTVHVESAEQQTFSLKVTNGDATYWVGGAHDTTTSLNQDNNDASFTSSYAVISTTDESQKAIFKLEAVGGQTSKFRLQRMNSGGTTTEDAYLITATNYIVWTTSTNSQSEDAQWSFYNYDYDSSAMKVLTAYEDPTLAKLSTRYKGNDPATLASSTDTKLTTVYLYNPATGLFLGRGGNWGTEGVLTEIPYPFTIGKSETTSNGATVTKYTFKSTTGSGDNKYLGATLFQSGWDNFNTFIDATADNTATQKNGDYTERFVLEKVEGSENLYTFKINVHANLNAQSGSKMTVHTIPAGDYYLTAAHYLSSSSHILNDSSYVNMLPASLQAKLQHKTDQWMIVTRQELENEFQTATASTAAPANADFMVIDAGFDRDDNSVTTWKTDKGNSLLIGESSGEASDDVTSHTKIVPSGQTKTYYVGNGYSASLGTGDGSSSPAGLNSESGQHEHGGKWTANIKGSGTIKQSVTPIRQGWYMVRCNVWTTSATAGAAKLYAQVGDATEEAGSKLLKATYATANVQSATAPETYVAANDLVNNVQILADGTPAYQYNTVVNVYVAETNGAFPQLTFGVQSTDANAWTCMDNFQLYYTGDPKYNIILRDDRTDVSYMNTQLTDRGDKKTVLLNRKLNAGKWNSLVLPLNLDEDDITSAFGAGTIISRFYGADDPDYPTRMFFREVKTIEAGKLYIIKPVNEMPTGLENVTSEFSDLSDLQSGDSYYTFASVAYGYDASGIEVASYEAKVQGEEGKNIYAQASSNYRFAGTYVSSTGTDNERIVPAYSYVLAGGNSTAQKDKDGNDIVAGLWYYVTKAQKVKGFRGWLEPIDQSSTSAKGNLTFEINGVVDDQTTAISNLFDDQPTAMPADNNVYGINGQLVRANSISTAGLAKGVYIAGGHKVVVK